MQYSGLPPTIQIVAEGLGRHQSQAILLAYIIEFYCCCHVLILFVLHRFFSSIIHIINPPFRILDKRNKKAPKHSKILMFVFICKRQIYPCPINIIQTPTYVIVFIRKNVLNCFANRPISLCPSNPITGMRHRSGVNSVSRSNLIQIIKVSKNV